MNPIKQAGFTLIELMIALALGLVIVAAATMLFLTSSRSQALQQGQASLQDDANFGLNYIVKDIRLGNLNTVQSSINDLTTYGGVVFRSSSNTVEVSGVKRANLPISLVGNSVSQTLLSRSHGLSVGTAPQWTGVSNVQGEASDQLTIQFVPQYILDSIQSGANHRYVDAATYMAMDPRPRILAVQLGVLVRSNQTVGGGADFKDDQTFRILDQEVTVTTPTASAPKYARQVVTQTVSLRNTFGERGQ